VVAVSEPPRLTATPLRGAPFSVTRPLMVWTLGGGVKVTDCAFVKLDSAYSEVCEVTT
jgi:hypothetical protein